MTRYAIYFSPAEKEDLTHAAAEWLGYNPWLFVNVEQIKVDGLSPNIFWQLTESPRRYGFHATLKAPMRLTEGASEFDLHKASLEFSRQTENFELLGLQLKWIGSFLALVPAENSSELQHLASFAVRHFEHLRAPLNDEEIARRKPKSLSRVQKKYLEEWGYPYVFDEFRFHMTLTGAVPADQKPAVEAAAAHHFSPWLMQPFKVERIAQFKQTAPDCSFHIVRSYTFEGVNTKSPVLPKVGTFVDG